MFSGSSPKLTSVQAYEILKFNVGDSDIATKQKADYNHVDIQSIV